MTSVGVMASAVAPPATGLMEPFNDYTTNSWALAGTPTIAAGRTGTAASMNGATATASYNIPSGEQADRLIVGFAYRITNLTAPTILTVRSDAGATEHSKLIVDGLGRYVLTRGGTQIGASSTISQVAVNTWYYFELLIVLSDTCPQTSLTARHNGTVVFQGASNPIDTRNGGAKTVYDQIRLGVGGSSQTLLVDDLYLSMGAGAVFKGDITIP